MPTRLTLTHGNLSLVVLLRGSAEGFILPMLDSIW